VPTAIARDLFMGSSVCPEFLQQLQGYESTRARQQCAGAAIDVPYRPMKWARAGLIFGLLAAVATAGCMDFSKVEGNRPIKTHVQDWRDQIIYQVITDRFADGDRSNDYRIDPSTLAHYQGGDWRGIEDHLDYLQQLGVTTLWISPIVKNVEDDAGVDGYHGYWTQDFTELNPHFGNLASLRELVDAVHARGMSIVLDIVVNDIGQLFYYDVNLNGQPDQQIEGAGPLASPPLNAGTSPVTYINEYDPPYDPNGVQAYTSLGPAGPAPIVFFEDAELNHMPPEPAIFQEPGAYHRRGLIYDFNDPQQVEKGDLTGGLKDINTESPQIRQALIDIFVHWVDLTDVDGFRIDTLKHVDHGFWQVFCKAVRQRLAAEGKKNFFMFGESFDGSDQLDGSFTLNNEVDSVVYFPQYYNVFRDVFQSSQACSSASSPKPTSEIQSLFDVRLGTNGQTPLYNTQLIAGGIGVPPNKALVNFIDNHDVGRFLFACPSHAVLENALLFLLTEDGIPCIYYGTEQGFHGGNDPANREVLWTTGFDESNPTYQWIARLTSIRRHYTALTHGDLSVVWSSDRTGNEADAGIIAFERAGGAAGSAYALVVINTNAKHASISEFNGTAMKTSLPAGTKLVNVLKPNDAPLTVASDGTLAVTVPATAGVILVRQADLIPGL
jgi:alpha-amylase